MSTSTYKVTVLSPTLVSDERSLSPIDYMVWKNQVNILDQEKIFRLLSKSPRLESYLSELRRARRLDFANWGGYAQTYAARRIPFEHESMTAEWNAAREDDLFIPLFHRGTQGAYLPGSALRGALRTAVLETAVESDALAKAVEGGRGAVLQLERQALRHTPAPAFGDSRPIDDAVFAVYRTRTAALASKSGPGLRWMEGVTFAEMASPGAEFRGALQSSSDGWIGAARQSAAELISAHLEFAKLTGMPRLTASLEDALAKQAATPRGALVQVGWGGGFLSKSLARKPGGAREPLEDIPSFRRALHSGFPFPKTRRIVTVAGEPAFVPGFVLIEPAQEFSA